jgi:lipopolysaccharide/colanic/teichoic acid biosynthesis glycosyltransferase
MSTDELTHRHLVPARSAASPGSVAASRALDITVAVAVLLVLAPLLLLIAVLIRMESPGSPIFRQRRVGRDEVPFTVYKFRTMRAGADPAPHRAYLVSQITGESAVPDGNGQTPVPIYKLARDDRITRVGRVLRRTSLDEIPQMLNVVRGQMALVGPRPAIQYEVDHYPQWFHERFAVKPGVTGLWQVSGRNQRTFEEMIRLDVEYARRRSLLLDLSILARTPWAVLTAKGVA